MPEFFFMLKKIFTRFGDLLVLLIFLIIILFLVSHIADNRINIKNKLVREIESRIHDSLRNNETFNSYKKVKDSIEKIKQWHINKISTTGNSTTTLFFGISRIRESDSCCLYYDDKNNKALKDKYFIILPGFQLDDESSFFIDNGKYYLRNTQVIRSYPSGNGEIQDIRFEIKQIPVRYSHDLEYNAPQSRLLIPVSKKTYAFFKILLFALMIPLSVLFFYFIFILPAKVLYRIAMGQAFTKKNIQNLTIAGVIMLAIPFISMLFSLVIKLLLGDRIPSHNKILGFFPSMVHRFLVR